MLSFIWLNIGHFPIEQSYRIPGEPLFVLRNVLSLIIDKRRLQFKDRMLISYKSHPEPRRWSLNNRKIIKAVENDPACGSLIFSHEITGSRDL